ncbi:hypothetical protein RQP46_011497 [Phenoliferia psychrophenolica]
MRSSSTSGLLVGAAFVGLVKGHMSPFMKSMYGIGGSRNGQDWLYSAGDPVSPIGPDVPKQDDWWFRGPAYRALAPPAGAVTEIPAGGKVTMDITCHVAFSGVGWSTTTPGSKLDACPSGTAGPYHSGDASSYAVEDSLLSGCALGIADVDDISKVTMDNLAIFSVVEKCVKQRLTDFQVPAMMPKCTGAKCICAWFWLANSGQANFYMTAFDCSVTNANPAATKIGPLSDATWCKPGDASCKLTTGAKRPMYAYNTPTNVVLPGAPYVFNDDRPGYHASWSWKEGAQNDIFLPAGGDSADALAKRVADIAARKAANKKAARRDNAAEAGAMCTHTIKVPCAKLPALLEQLEDSSMLDGMMAGQGM